MVLCSLQSICTGASGTVEHVDWSYALTHGSLAEQGRYILQSNDGSREVLHWDGLTGKKVTSNQRDAQWASWTCPLGFPVLGIWPDYADGAHLPPMACMMSLLCMLSPPVHCQTRLNSHNAVRGHSQIDSCTRAVLHLQPSITREGCHALILIVGPASLAANPAAGTDINAVARSSLGAPVNEDTPRDANSKELVMRPRPPTKLESADGVPGACFIATADDYAHVKLFNGPAVADDAPFRAYRGHASHVLCEPSPPIFVSPATGKHRVLCTAVLRAGRFSHWLEAHVYSTRPDVSHECLLRHMSS